MRSPWFWFGLGIASYGFAAGVIVYAAVTSDSWMKAVACAVALVMVARVAIPDIRETWQMFTPRPRKKRR